MKRIFISMAAVALCAAMASAEEGDLVKNGSFDKPGYVQAVPGGYTWDPWNKQNYLSVLPDWILRTAGEWNGGIELIDSPELEGGEGREDEDKVCVKLVGYNDNGWAKIALNQVLENAVPGQEYTLSFTAWGNFPEGANVDAGYQIGNPEWKTEKWQDSEGNEVVDEYWAAGKELKTASIKDELNEAGDWCVIETTFKAEEDKVFLSIYYGNYTGEGNKVDGKWMYLDNVKVIGEVAGIEDVVAGDVNAPVELYNLNGVRVSEGNAAPGLYIRKQGNKVEKVTL